LAWLRKRAIWSPFRYQASFAWANFASSPAFAALMRAHLDQTLEEAAARLKGDFAADIRAYDEIHQHILVMADTLSSGIVEQFPAKFR
jgi:hypothetical protein